MVIILGIIFFVVFGEDIINGVFELRDWYCYGDILDKREVIQTIGLIVITIAIVIFCAIDPKVWMNFI